MEFIELELNGDKQYKKVEETKIWLSRNLGAKDLELIASRFIMSIDYSGSGSGLSDTHTYLEL